MRWEKSLSHLAMSRVTNLEGQLPLGNDSSFGQLNNFKDSRDGRRVHIPSGSDLNFSQLKILISIKFEAHNPPLEKDTKFRQEKIAK